MSCAKEPLPGWNDNLNGPSGMVLGCSMGIIRATHCDITKKVDFVPADMAINAMIAAAWYANTNGIT
jgi:fatty acyl-CoA reductase